MDAASESIGLTVRWLVLIMMMVMVYEAIARRLFNSPTIWAHEFDTMLFGAYFLLGGAYVLRHEAHVNLDIFYRKLSPRAKARMDVATYTLMFIYCYVLLLYAVPYAWDSVSRFEHGTTIWGPPLWPLKLIIPISVILLMFQGISRYIRSLYTFITGRQLP
jgi:TRAP-type mannitol/chloroaromatic compound transport system permease small subunit